MLTSLLWRPLRPGDPTRTYYLLNGGTSFLLCLAFTLSQVYYVTVVGLSPLQVVLVGTVLESTCFLFEVPTGVVADLWSRRLSIIVGVVLTGLAMLLQGLFPTFLAVLLAQGVWGIGYTFTSGADEAWITDEIGDEAVPAVFTRETQISLGMTFLGTLAAGAIGLRGIGIPMVASGIGLVLLAIALLVVMPERNFERRPVADRESFGGMAATVRDGVSVARLRPVVRAFFLISLVTGLSSEAIDRLWSVRVLEDFRLPDLLGLSGPVVWFTIFALVGTVVSLAVSLLVNRYAAALVGAYHPNRLLAVTVALQALAVVAVALGANLWVVLAALWGRGAAGTIAAPVRSAWLNRHLDSRSRATVISMNGQLDAVGQVIGGPPLGALANRTSSSTAMVVSAVVLAPAIGLYLRLRDDRAEPSAPEQPRTSA